MDTDRLLTHLRADGPRLIAVAQNHLSEPVPGCPGWSVRDLVLHVAEVYQHKVAVLREGKPPRPWPPDRGDIDPIEHLRQSHAAIVVELMSRPPEEPAWTWASDGVADVHWWVRRMAQETAVHRWDGEQAAGTVTPIDPQLALDGVDELITAFLRTAAVNWFEELAPHLAATTGEVIAVRTGGRSWVFALHPDRVEFDAAGEPTVVLGGEPEAVLLWLWGRLGTGSITVTGDRAVMPVLRKVLDVVGQ